MSASSKVIWRVLQALRIVSRPPSLATAARPVAVDAAAPETLTATIEIVALLDVAATAAPAAVVIEPDAAAAVEVARRPAMPHPLARQLAYTASRNVPKGRKAQPAPAPALAGKRRIPTVVARPVVQNTVKKAPKRRHVWLCNQSRVIRPVGANVVPLNAARVRTVQKPGSQKTVRLLKLAA